MKQYIIIIVLIFCYPETGCANTFDSLQVRKQIEAMQQMYYVTPKDSAYQALAKILHSTQEANQWQLSIETMITWAMAANYYSDFSTMQQYLHQSEKLYQKKLVIGQENQPLLSKVLFSIARLYYQINDLQKSNRTFLNCLKIAGKTDSTFLTEIYFYLGDNYYDLSNFYLSQLYFDLAAQWIPANEDYNFYLSQILSRQAGMAVAEGNLEKGDKLFSQSLQLLLDIKNYTPKNAISYGYLTLADVYVRQNRFGDALLAMQSIDNYLEKDHVIHIRTSKFKGDIYQKRKQWNKAIDYYQQCIARCDLFNNSSRKAEALNQVALTYLQLGEYEKALLACNNSLQSLDESFQPKDPRSLPTLQKDADDRWLLEALKIKGSALFARYQKNKNEDHLQASINHFQLALELIDNMRGKFQTSQYKKYVAKYAQSIYENAIEVVYAGYQLSNSNNYQELLYTLLERNKNRMLLQSIAKIPQTHYHGIADSLLNAEKNLQLQISYLEDQMNQAQQKNKQIQVEDIRMKLVQSQQKFEQLVTLFQQKHPNYYQIKYAPSIIPFAQIQKQLTADQAIINYFFGKSKIYSMAMTPNKILIEPVDIPADKIKDQVKKLLNSTRQPGFNQKIDLTGYDLYKALLETLIKKLPQNITRLKIIPDGPLAYLPFEILPANNTDKVSKTSLQSFLLHKYAISYAYSFSTNYHQQLIQNRQSKKHVYAGFAPNAEDWNLTTHPFYHQENQPTQLPATTEEVKQLKSIFGGTTYLQARASESNFKLGATNSKIIHIASHALVHEEYPQYSGILLSYKGKQFNTLFASIDNQEPAEDTVDDGFLHLHELYNMQIDAELAILSACETGFGTLEEGEGVMSLGRGFAYAGCPSVVMSLWQANDQTTAQLMKDFATYLKAGLPKDVALQQAKLDYLSRSDKITSDPYYWSAFVLTGNDQSLDLGNSAKWNYWLIAGIILFSIILLGWWQRFRYGR